MNTRKGDGSNNYRVTRRRLKGKRHFGKGKRTAVSARRESDQRQHMISQRGGG